MPNIPNNLRKAAILIRSLDPEMAATLLAQLPAADADAVRRAIATLGPVDAEEQDDVVAELRRTVPVSGAAKSAGVELTLSPETISPQCAHYGDRLPSLAAAKSSGSRFEFLERAPIASLVPYLSREHVQTIAVVLSHLTPARAATVLAALPARQQSSTLERLSAIGETDAESVKVVEQELAAWLASQSANHHRGRPLGAADAILAAADAPTRERILANLKSQNSHLAARFNGANSPPPAKPPARPLDRSPTKPQSRLESRFGSQLDSLRAARATLSPSSALPTERKPVPLPPKSKPASTFHFDDLLRLDDVALQQVLRGVDTNVLLLALVGSTDELIRRITALMPRRAAKAFRRQLTRLGPTRLSDVEQAQQSIAQAAAVRLRAVLAG
jgi:flagellar motor switch protein FliG